MKSKEQEEKRVCAFIDTLGTGDIFLNNTNGKKQELIRLIRKLVERNASHSMNTQNLDLVSRVTSIPHLSPLVFPTPGPIVFPTF